MKAKHILLTVGLSLASAYLWEFHIRPKLTKTHQNRGLNHAFN